VKVPLVEIFKAPTIKGISGYIKRSRQDRYVSITPAEKKEYYVLSSAQTRVYILQQMELNNIGYNCPAVMWLEREPDKEKLGQVFRKLIERHESFRTSFTMINRGPVQRVYPRAAFEIEYHEAGSQKEVEEIIEGFIRPFDLKTPPLVRAGLIKTGEKKHVLMIDMHHIVSDGVSSLILIKEFAVVYAGTKLPGLPLQYKDYAEWQNRRLTSGVMKKQEEYWLNQFTDRVPLLSLPTDYPGKPGNFEGHTSAFSLNRKLADKIYNFALERGVTLYMVLLAVFNVLLSKYADREDVVVGSPVFCRNHADLQNIIGMFVNMLPMRNYPLKNKTFAAFLEEVKENALGAFENQDYQFEQLVWELDKRNGSGPRLEVNAVFVLENLAAVVGDIPEVEGPELGIKPYDMTYKISKFDLTLGAYERESGIDFDIEYSKGLFKSQTIEGMWEHLVNILEEVIENPRVRIAEIKMLSEKDKMRVLNEIKGEEYAIDAAVRQEDRKIEVEFGF
jgi:hypothetical protein